MNLPFPGHHSPTVGLEVPLEMLAACHGRVSRQCELLGRLQTHLAAHGADAPARDAAQAVMRYFDTAARHHHEDEEIDLLPALIASMAGSDAVCLRELTAALTAEHRTLEGQWRVLRAALQDVAGAASPDAPARGYSSTMSYCSGFIVGSAASEIGLPMKADRSAKCELSSSSSISTTAALATTRNSFGLNCRASRRISRSTS
jgi:hypothetical protein